MTRAGYNLLTSRSVKDSSSVPSASCNNGLVCNTWSSPRSRCIRHPGTGEQQQQTCEGCQKTVTAAGVGLTPLIQETYDKKLQSLQELLSKSKPLTAENLAAAGTDALPITRGVIEALRDERDQDVLARRLASDVSLMDVLSKALLLQRLMFAGAKEPNVAANGLATQAVDQQTSLLQQEISNLKTELELRRELASNSPCGSSSAGNNAPQGPVACSSRRPMPIASIGCRNPPIPATPAVNPRASLMNKPNSQNSALTARKLLSATLLGVLMLLLLSLAGLFLSVVAVHYFGGIQAFETWRDQHYDSLLAWRLCLYGLIALGWLKVKQKRTFSAAQRTRILRIELLVILLFVLLESSKAYVHTGA